MSRKTGFLLLSFVLFFQFSLLAQNSFYNTRPSFSSIVTPLLDYQEEDFFEQQRENLLKLEFFYYNPLVFSKLTEDDLDAFFFLSEDEKKALLTLKNKQVIQKREDLKTMGIIAEESLDVFKNFIRFVSFSKEDSPLKAEYKIGFKNKNLLDEEADKIKTYQVRNLYNLFYEKDDFLLNFHLFLEKDIDEHDFFDFFKLSLALQLEASWRLYLGALDIEINQNLLFSTKNPSYSNYLNKNGGYRSSSRVAASKSKREVYYAGVAFEYFWQNLRLFLFGGNYLYHLTLSTNNPLYPGLTYSKSFNFNEKSDFSLGENSLKETIIGFYLEYIFPNLKLSTSFVATRFTHPVISSGEPYGEGSYGWSVAWDYLNPYFIFFGETVLLFKEEYENAIYTKEKSYLLTYAFYQGIKVIEDNFSATITLRVLDENYTALHNNLYTAFSDKKNELGVLSSLSVKINKVRMSLTLDYAKRMFNENDFIFNALFETSWRSEVGYYFKARSNLESGLTNEKINFTFYNGIKKNEWDWYLKTFLRVNQDTVDTLWEINNSTTILNNYLTSFKLGWGREEENNIAFFYFHNTLFVDFISLQNDSFWFFWGNVLKFHKAVRLELDLGFIFKTNENRNYNWDSLEKELYLSLMLSGNW